MIYYIQFPTLKCKCELRNDHEKWRSHFWNVVKEASFALPDPKRPIAGYKFPFVK